MVRDRIENVRGWIKKRWRSSCELIIKSFGNTKKIIYWLFKIPFYFWLAILIVFFATIIILQWPTEPIIRSTGLVLQLFGISTVAFGVWTLVRQWWSLFPQLGRRGTTATVEIGSVEWIARIKASDWVKPADDSLEERLKAAEKNLKWVGETVIRLEKEMRNRFDKHKIMMHDDKKMMQKEVQEIRKEVMTAQMRGMYISAIGAILIFVGVILSTISDRISLWIG